MGKIKIHELAKKLNVNSKQIIETANELGIVAKSHLSSIEEEQGEKIEKALLKDGKQQTVKNNKKENIDNNKKESKPVIIRREVIITDNQTEELEQNQNTEQKKQEVGFVEKERKTDFNIVYRNKQTKPLTVDELFGRKKEEKNEEPTIESKKERQEVKTTKTMAIKDVKVEEKPITETVQKVEVTKNVEEQKRKVEAERPVQQYNNNQKNNNTNGYRNYGYNNNRQRNNNYQRNNDHNNNQHNSQNNNRQRNNGNNSNNNYQRNNNQNSGNYNNRQRNNYNNGRKPLDSIGIEKNIKNIMATEQIEKESVREYQNKAIDKQKINRYEEPKKKQTKSRKDENFDMKKGKIKDLKQVDKLSHLFNEGEMLDYYDLTTQRGRKSKKKIGKEEKENRKQKIFKLTDVTIPENITVKDLAIELKKTSGEIIKKLFAYGIMATINNELDFDTAFLVAQDFGVTAHKKEVVTEEDILFDETEDTEEELLPRPPVVVVMGHVDHGKTSLLDAIRKTNVIEGEAGGITQHIGAYKVDVKGREVTFLDTPGHEAFTSMRARGAQITDIAILVVAANDGVMPQTIEAINHAKAANIPIVVAVNKIDLEGANLEKIKQELTEYGLVPEEWGGDTIFVPISAKHNQNIDTLLEMLILVADMKELKANPNKQSKGAVIEARLDKNRGPIATMLVQRGTLDVGDTIIVGSVIGRIRQMTNDKGQKVKKAGPSTPVEITGLTSVPEAGEVFYEVKDEKTAKQLIDKRKRQERDAHLKANTRVTLDELFNYIEQANIKQIQLIVKADVQGSVEAVKQSLEKLTTPEIKVKVIHSNVGTVTESDVNLANVSNAIIIAFNVGIAPIAKSTAEKNGIDIKTYSVIYQAIEDIERAMKGMAEPVYEDKIIGHAEVRQTFKVSNVGTIAGCYVTDGKITRNSSVKVMRENNVIHEGKIQSLKRFKDDVKEVTYGYECGLEIENFNDIKEGDILEIHIMEEIKQD